MMFSINESIVPLIRIAAIIFALVHLLAGLILIRQTSRMNAIIRTQNRGCLTIVGIVYGLVLLAVLILVVTLPF